MGKAVTGQRGISGSLELKLPNCHIYAELGDALKGTYFFSDP